MDFLSLIIENHDKRGERRVPLFFSFRDRLYIVRARVKKIKEKYQVNYKIQIYLIDVTPGEL